MTRNDFGFDPDAVHGAPLEVTRLQAVLINSQKIMEMIKVEKGQLMARTAGTPMAMTKALVMMGVGLCLMVLQAVSDSTLRRKEQTLTLVNAVELGNGLEANYDEATDSSERKQSSPRSLK